MGKPRKNRGVKARAKAAANTLIASDADREAMDEMMQDAPPMVTAVLAASIIEFELDDLLRRFFHNPSDSMWAALTSPIGPLATFNQKIIAAYATQVFDESVYKNLNIIRSIRNLFAHPKKVLDFQDPSVAILMDALQLPDKSDVDLYDAIDIVKKSFNDRQNGFMMLCYATSTRIYKNRIKVMEQLIENDELRRTYADMAAYSVNHLKGFRPNALLLGVQAQSDNPNDVKPAQPRPDDLLGSSSE